MASPATPAKGRPLSPHLQIYRRSATMTMSILHRITGAAIYFGTLLLAWWLVAVAQGAKYYDFVNQILGHPLGKLVLLGYSWALIHHMLGGIRHLYWDTGRGFALSSSRLMAWMTIIGSLALTAALWLVGLYMRGAF